MATELTLLSVCAPPADVVASEFDGELMIVPLLKAPDDPGRDLVTLSHTGRAVWRSLDGKRTLGEVAEGLALEFGALPIEVEADVLDFASDMLRRGLLLTKA